MTPKKDATFLAHVLDQLEGLEGLRSRAMFGGHGLYLGADFFGIVWKGAAYFKVDDASRVDYEKHGSEPFCVVMRGKTMTMQYLSVPADVLEDRETLRRWAARAAKAYREGKAKKSGRVAE